MKYINLKDDEEEKISFVGKGTVDGKDTEIHFKVMSSDIKAERDDWGILKITMFPTVNGDLSQVKIINVDKKEKDEMREQINNNFKYHPPKGDQVDRYTDIRDVAKGLAIAIDDYCPNSREKSLAITKLEEAVMWANASISRNETSEKEESLTIGEIKREIVFSITHQKAEEKLLEIVKNLDNGEILLEKKRDYIKTDRRSIGTATINPRVLESKRGTRISTAYVDEDTPFKIVSEFIKPMLLTNNGEIKYF